MLRRRSRPRARQRSNRELRVNGEQAQRTQGSFRSIAGRERETMQAERRRTMEEKNRQAERCRTSRVAERRRLAGRGAAATVRRGLAQRELCRIETRWRRRG